MRIDVSTVSLLISPPGDNGSQIFSDLSSAGRAITATGDVAWNNAVTLFGDPMIYFDGSGDYLTTPYVVADFSWWIGCTISAWVYATDWSTWGYSTNNPAMIGNCSPTAVYNYWSFGPRSDGKLGLYYFNGSAQSAATTGAIPTDVLTHVALTVEPVDGAANIIRLFVGGVKAYEGTVSGTPQSSAAYPLVVGQVNNNCLTGYVGDILFANEPLWVDDFFPPTSPWSYTQALERYFALSIASRTEQTIGIAVPVSSYRELAQQLRIAPSRRAERALNLLIDISTLYERALRLPITGYIGREAFQRLRISGALAQLEQYKEFTIADFDRVYCEAFQRFSIYAGLAGLVKEVGVALFINGSAIPFETGSGGDREGVYFKSYEFTTIYNDLIRSLPDPTKSRPSAQIAWASEIKTEGGSQIVFDWVIELILDSITVSRVTDQSTKHTSQTATIRLVSPTAALGWLDGNLGAAPITASWPSGTMATTILDDIFPNSLSYDLQLDDFPIGQQLDVDELYPNEIIPLFLIEYAIHTASDGTLIIRNRPEVRGTVTPTHNLSPSDYEMSAVDSDDQGQYRPNVIRVANFQEADSSQSLPAPEIVVNEDDPRRAVVYAYPVPFRQVWLRTSRIPSTGFTQNSGLSQTVNAGDGQGELVEFLEGQGSTTRPITGGFDSVDYGNNADLGTVTPNEDGTLTAAIKSRSMGVVKYSTKRYAFEISLAGAINSVFGSDGSTTVVDSLGNSIQLWFVDEDDL